MSAAGIRPLARLSQLLFVWKEVATPNNLSEVFGSANEWDGVQGAMNRAANHAFTADRTRERRHGDDGSDPGKRPGEPAGYFPAGVALELICVGHKN